MKKAFIHIGTHKTGSTTIQHFIATNEEFLGNHSIYLPQTGKRDVEYADYQNIAWELSDNKKFNKNNGTVEELKNEILRVNPPNIILSSEAFGFQPSTSNLPEKLKLFFEQLGYEIYIIAFVRPQYRYIDSMYSEMTKRGIITISFDNYVKRALKSKRYNYLELFKEWKSNFNNITIVPFEKAQWESSLEVEFFKNLPVEIDLEYVNNNIDSSQNEREDTKYIEIVRVTVKECIQLGLTQEEIKKVIREIRKLSKKYKWDFGSFCGLDNETASLIFNYFEKDNYIFARDFLHLNNENLFLEKKEDFKFSKNIFEYNDILIEEKLAINKVIKELGYKIDRTEKKKKKKLCIVHIGMHKTGSSSIQHNLQKKQGKNFSYFDLGEKNHSFMIGSFFARDTEEYHLNKSRSGFDKSAIYNYNKSFDNKFRKHLLTHDQFDTFVLSGEAIIGLTEKSLSDFKSYLLMFFENIKIVAYVRPPLSYMNSSFFQLVKTGRMRFFSIMKSRPRYKKKLEKFDLIFDKENVFLYFFDKKYLIDGDITVDFLKNNNLEVFNESFRSTNVSLSLEAMSLLYIYHKYNKMACIDKSSNLLNRKLIKRLSGFGTTQSKLGEKALTPFLNKFSDDIQWMEDRIGMKFMDNRNYFDMYSKDNFYINDEADLIKLAKHIHSKFKEFIENKYLIQSSKGNNINNIVDSVDKLYNFKK